MGSVCCAGQPGSRARAALSSGPLGPVSSLHAPLWSFSQPPRTSPGELFLASQTVPLQGSCVACFSGSAQWCPAGSSGVRAGDWPVGATVTLGA